VRTTADWIDALDRPDAPTEPAVQMAVLLDYPVALGGEMNERTVEVLRELRLMTSGGSPASIGTVASPAHAADLGGIDRLAHYALDAWADDISEPSRELRRALEHGEPTTVLRYQTQPGGRSTVLDYARMMETLDDYCRRAVLMTLAPRAEVYALRRWTVEQYVAQFDGEPPQPWRSPER